MDIGAIIDKFVEQRGSDLYITVGSAIIMRNIAGKLEPIHEKIITPEDIHVVMQRLLSENIINEFESTMEYNTAINWKDSARLRINLFKQRQHNGLVIRRIHTSVPSLESLTLPKVYSDLIMEKRGLILIVGPTGSGKSTSLASMLEYRNLHGNGHIVTVEDPIEYILQHKNCIITQRDVGIDTYSFSLALKNALRQAPDVIVVGEIRDRDTMEQAITFSETGHLCLATLHAQNSHQAIERIINFFPQEKHKQVLLNLSLDLRAVLSQRLVYNLQGGRTVALEIMLNNGLIKTLIQEEKIRDIKEMIERGGDQGMQTFDQHLFKLLSDRIIDETTALAEADSPSNMRLAMKQKYIGGRAEVELREPAQVQSNF